MAAANYPRPILDWLAEYEGGFVDHKDDPGGATHRGVTQRVYDRYRQSQGEPMRSVRKLTDDEHAAIYRDRYWARVRGDELPSGVDLAVFDAAVNSGPKQAVLWLQRAVGVADDGVMGPVTLGAVGGLPAAATVDSICDQRLRMLKGLKHWPTFQNGWKRRVASVRERGKSMALVFYNVDGSVGSIQIDGTSTPYNTAPGAKPSEPPKKPVAEAVAAGGAAAVAGGTASGEWWVAVIIGVVALGVVAFILRDRIKGLVK